MVDDYEVIDELGKGSYGSVVLARQSLTAPKASGELTSRKGESSSFQDSFRSRREELVAIKILTKDHMRKSEDGMQALFNEVRVHWALEHCQGVLKLLKIYEDPWVVKLVLEYQPKGSLM